jgi:gliding motility-associated-like protein
MGPAPFTYTVQVSTDPTFATGVTTINNIASTNTSYAVTGLNSASAYYYRVVAVNATTSSVSSAVSQPISTLIVPTTAGCNAGTGDINSPGAIARAYVLPVIDGSSDAVWANAPANNISFQSVGGGPNTGSTWQALWSPDTLYFLVKVQDPAGQLITQKNAPTVAVPGGIQTTSTNYYDSDGVEITLDPDYSHGTSYDGINDVQFRFNLGGATVSGQSCGGATQFCGTVFNAVASRIDFKIVTTATGYTVEAAIPWGHDAANPGINARSGGTYGTASVNQPIGVEVQVNDATGTGGRSAQYSWFNGSSQPYQDPSQFAKAQLYSCATPPTVVSPTVTNISATGATFGATVTAAGDGGTLKARGTGFSTSVSANENAMPEGGTGVGTPYSGPARTGLTPQTKYYYEGYAINAYDETGISPVKSFYTLSALPTVQPTITAATCTQMTLNWNVITFPIVAQASQTGYLLLRTTSPAPAPTTTGITTRIATLQGALPAGTTLVATINGGSTVTYTDATATAGNTYNYLLVPFTWDGTAADSTYNYFTTSPSGITASIGGVPAVPAATVTQQPTCSSPTGTITINPVDPLLTYSVDGITFSAGPTFSGLTPNTTYNVVAKNSSGCISASQPLTINAATGPAAPAATPVEPTCTVSTGSISITPVAGLTYSIDGTNYFASTDPVFTNLVPGTYQLTAEDNNSCISTPTPVTINQGVGIEKTSVAPTIDGTADGIWSNFTSASLTKVEPIPAAIAITGPADLSATYQTTRDANNLYVFVNVTDDVVEHNGINPWDNDGIELFIDMGNTKTSTYGANDYQYGFVTGSSMPIEYYHSATTGVTFAQGAMAGGYTMEISIPWTTLGGAPADGDFIGFDIGVNDNDDGGARDSKISWTDSTDAAHNDPSAFGTLKISDCEPCPTGILSGDAKVCNTTDTSPLSVSFTGSAPWTFTYSIDGVTQPAVSGISISPYVFQSAAGAHTYALVSVSNAVTSGCTGNATGTATIGIFTNVPVGHDGTFVAPDSATLSVTNTGGVYQWFNTAGNLIFTGPVFNTPVLTDTAVYYVQDALGDPCRTIVKAIPVTIAVPLFIPNLVTPDGNGSNDYFGIVGLPSGSSLKIFNRWGERVYQNNDYDNKWSGSDNADGVYYYDLVTSDGGKYKGWLNLVR